MIRGWAADGVHWAALIVGVVAAIAAVVWLPMWAALPLVAGGGLGLRAGVRHARWRLTGSTVRRRFAGRPCRECSQHCPRRRDPDAACSCSCGAQQKERATR